MDKFKTITHKTMTRDEHKLIVTDYLTNFIMDRYCLGDYFWECCENPERAKEQDVTEHIIKRLEEAKAHNYDAEWIIKNM